MLTRTATRSDLDSIIKLLTILFEQEKEFTHDPDRQRQGVETILSDSSLGTFLVAEDAGRVVGMCSILITVSTALGGRVGLLEDVIVLPGNRRKGIGTALLDAGIQAARDAGCLRLTLLTDGTNAGAQRFYGSHGFVLSEMMPMRKLLV